MPFLSKRIWIVLVLVTATVFTSEATADVRLTEQWSVHLGHNATALGSNWMENDHLRVVIGLDSGAAVTEDRNVLWVSEPIGQTKTAVSRVVFTDHSTEIVAMNFEGRDLLVDRYRGADFAEHQQQRFEYGFPDGDAVDYRVNWIGESVWGGETCAPVGFQTEATSSTPHSASTQVSGNLLMLDLAREGGSILSDVVEVGKPAFLQPYDFIGDGSSQIVCFASLANWAVSENPDTRRVTVSSGSQAWLRIVREDKTISGSRLLREGFYFGDDAGVGNHALTNKALGGCLRMVEGEQYPLLLGAFSDTAGTHLIECRLFDMSIRREANWELHQPASLGIIHSEEGDRLLGVTGDGHLAEFDLTTFRQIGGVGQILNEPVVGAKIGDFDNDAESELLLLTVTSLRLFDVTPLSVESAYPLTPYTRFLSPPFPNPFNSSTTISYTLPRSGWTTMDVMDVNGRFITMLSDGWKEAGSYRQVWDGKGMGSGSYLVRLDAENVAATQRVTLIR